jgi:hypothetical protein
MQLLDKLHKAINVRIAHYVTIEVLSLFFELLVYYYIGIIVIQNMTIRMREI